MKKILIITIIIVGIFGAWFIKNKDSIVDVGDGAHDIPSEEENVGDGAHDIPSEEENVGDGAHDIPLEEESVGDGVHDIPSEENNVGDGAHDIPPVKIDKNDLNFELSTPSFDIETLKTYGLPILLDFGASWCNPCQRMHPVLEEVNSELRGRAIIKYIDIDLYPEATKGFDFTLIPTQYFIDKDGEIYKTHTGIMQKEDVIKILNDMGME